MLGLDGQFHPAPGVGDESEQPLQGEYGGRLAVLRGVLPVGFLVAPLPGLARLPGAEVQGGEIGELQGGDRAAAVGRTVDPTVVHAHQVAVGGEAHIALEGVRTVLDRFGVRGQGVLGGLLGGSSVGDDLNHMLPCVGHRVMVPPSPGTRPVVRTRRIHRSVRRHWNCSFSPVMTYIKNGRGPTATAYGALTSRGKS